jgi:hypothetical protein
MFKSLFNKNNKTEKIPESKFDELILSNNSFKFSYEAGFNKLLSNDTENVIEDELDINSIEKGTRAYKRAEVKIINQLIQNGELLQALEVFENGANEFINGDRKYFSVGRLDDETNIILNFIINSVDLKDRVFQIALKLLLHNPLWKDREVLYPCLIINKDETLIKLLDEFDSYNDISLEIFKETRNQSVICGNLFLLAPVIAPKLGMDYWNFYISTEPFWENYNAPFSIYQVTIAYYVDKEKQLSELDKENILTYILDNNERVNSDSSWFSDYNKLLIYYFPEYSNQDILKYIPNDQKRYKSDFKGNTFDTEMNIKDFISLLGDSVGIDLKLGLHDEAMFNYYNGFYTINTFKQNLSSLFNHFLKKTNSYISLVPDCGCLPVDHDTYYESYVFPILNKNLTNYKFSIKQESENKEVAFNYEVCVSNSKKSIRIKFSDKSDYYYHHFLTIVINRLLIDSETDKRLVNIEQAVIVGVPEKIIPFLQRFNQHGWATKYDDGWMKNNSTQQ